MNTALLQLLTTPDPDDQANVTRGSRAELAEKWLRRAAFLEAFALDCREREDTTMAVVLEAVAQAHRSDARDLHAHILAGR